MGPPSFFLSRNDSDRISYPAVLHRARGSREATAAELQDEFHDTEEPEPMAGASARLSGETLIVPQILAAV